jgi:hypothetical protein
MAQRQDLKLQRSPIAERPRIVNSNETTTDRIVGPYPRMAARSMFSRRTRFLVGTVMCRRHFEGAERLDFMDSSTTSIGSDPSKAC